jgi:autocrine motility factor receptor
LLSHLLKDQVGTFVIINFVFWCYALSVVVTKALFLGPLSAIEAGKLSERMLKFLMLKLVFIAAVSGPGMPDVALWVTWFAVVGWLKMFVGLARDRFDSLISSPSATFFAHARTLALLLIIFANDIACIALFMNNHEKAPLGHLTLWLFDVVVALFESAAIMVKYGVYMTDQLHEREGWEGKGDFLYKVELAADMAVKSLTLSHLTQLWFLHGFAFRFLDAVLFMDIRHLTYSICSCVRRYLKYRSALSNLNNSFPDASSAEGHLDKECAICREKMQGAKQLPCQHCFHLPCLTAWLQQSGSDNFTCPLCRLPLFAAKDDHGSGDAGGRSGESEPQLSVHDVEAETFSSQILGQALQEAARSLAEGGNTLMRQNWTVELARLELMTQNLRARLSLDRRRASQERSNVPRPRSSLSLAFLESEGGAVATVSSEDSLATVQDLERQLHGIRDTLATCSSSASLSSQEAAVPELATDQLSAPSWPCGGTAVPDGMQPRRGTNEQPPEELRHRSSWSEFVNPQAA